MDKQKNNEYRKEFDKYDVNGDGFLDTQEFRKILEEISKQKDSPIPELQHTPTNKEIEEMFKSANICDNKMNYEAFRKMILMVTDVDREIREQFNYFDANGDGKISKKELKKGLKKLKQDSSSKIVKAMIKDADVDGDGEVDFEEFKSILLN